MSKPILCASSFESIDANDILNARLKCAGDQRALDLLNLIEAYQGALAACRGHGYTMEGALQELNDCEAELEDERDAADELRQIIEEIELILADDTKVITAEDAMKEIREAVRRAP